VNEERPLRGAPSLFRSARFRIAILYSSALFVLAAALVGTLYYALQASLRDDGIGMRQVPSLSEVPDETLILADIREFERQVNEQTLDNLRDFAFGALGALFVTSLGVGWVISGRVLAPIDEIAAVANDIQATDLSRRIGLSGPDDELKRLADTFDGMLDRLDEAFSLQRRFVADASHELRNPLAVIRTNLDVVLSNPVATESELRDAAQIVRRSTDRMSRMVDDLLALARLDSPTPRWETVDVAEVARDISEENAESARARDVSIEVSGAGAGFVRGDRDALKRALANLVENALRFAPSGTAVTIVTGTTDGWVFLAVRDRGPGIARDEHERVFERFYRIDRSRSRSSGGSGLGLAIVRRIATAHSGVTTVFSEPGAGATFVVWLPRDGAGAPAAPPPDRSPLVSA
jgi:signal transduction histidine kinase